MKIARTVVLVTLVVGCAQPANDHPAGSAPSSAQPPSASAARPATRADVPVLAPPLGAPGTSPSAPLASSAPAPAAVSSGSSAYVGCGQPIPLARLWDETTEGEVLDAISAAKACAAEHGRRLLLEFVAPWCADCQEMAKLDETPEVTATMQRRFERVRVNVGKWDRHEALRTSFDVHALATYIVIDPKTSKPLTKTTLEPITKKGQKLSARDWAQWLAQH